MIATLTGTLTTKNPTEAVLDVHGVGFSVIIPLSTQDVLAPVGATVTLLTHLVVREDALILFGFATEEERAIFRMLLTVNGIGPKMAVAVLSGMKPVELKNTIARGDARALTGIPGVGRKLAERLLVELRDKVGSLAADAATEHGIPGDLKSEAVLALVSLGFNRIAAEKAVRSAMLADPASLASLETLIKASLHRAQR